MESLLQHARALGLCFFFGSLLLHRVFLYIPSIFALFKVEIGARGPILTFDLNKLRRSPFGAICPRG
jgi:hypothetical protein